MTIKQLGMASLVGIALTLTGCPESKSGGDGSAAQLDEAAQDAKEAAQGAADDAKDAANEGADEAKDAGADAADTADEAGDEAAE